MHALTMKNQVGLNLRCVPAFLFAVAIALFPSLASAGSAAWNFPGGATDWNTDANWTPATGHPNGPTDVATFNLSLSTALSLSAATEVNGIVFNNSASAFTITANPDFTLTISGVGISNNSGLTQNFVTAGSGSGNGVIQFKNSATAGSQTVFTNNGGNGAASFTFFFDSSTAGNATIINNSLFSSNGITGFFNSATAGNATITNSGGTAFFSNGGSTQFSNSSTAGNASITNNGGTIAGAFGGFTQFFNSATAGNASIINNTAFFGYGVTEFFNSSTAGNATITNNSGGGFGGGITRFFDSSTAGNATIINNGGTFGFGAGVADFFNSSTAGNATIINNGGTYGFGAGGVTNFFNTSTAAAATLIAYDGTGGGSIFFFDNSTGGAARVEIFGNGFLNISGHNSPAVTVGSIEGSGNVFLGANDLAVGSNNLSTSFSGMIQDGFFAGGSLTKIGTGALTLSGANTYTGGTTINNGVLVVDNADALATGDVTLNNGTLQTRDNVPRTFNVGSDYFQNGGTLRIQIGGTNSGVNSDLMTVAGTAHLGSTLFLHRIFNYMPLPGDTVTIITDKPISGTFANVQNDFSSLVQPMVIYDPADVMVEFVLSASFQSQVRRPINGLLVEPSMKLFLVGAFLQESWPSLVVSR